MACEQSVRVWIDDKGAEGFMKLLCKGTCKAGEAPCEPSETVTGVDGDGKQIKVESCFCNGGHGDEKAGCRIVLVKSGDGKRSRRCDGKCDSDKDSCVSVPIGEPTEVPIPTKDNKYTGKIGTYVDYKCECKPKPKDGAHGR